MVKIVHKVQKKYCKINLLTASPLVRNCLRYGIDLTLLRSGIILTLFEYDSDLHSMRRQRFGFSQFHAFFR